MNITGLGKRPVMRVVVLQAACATLTGLSCFIFGGIAAAGRLYRALIAAESLKWIWYVLALWAALARVKLMPAPLIVGVVAGQFGHWLSLVVTKRGQ
jgi:F0F1-type ATP synthase assembly protein I